MNYQELCRQLAEAVDKSGKRLYDAREARAVARVFLEDYCGFDVTDLYSGKSFVTQSGDERNDIGQAVDRLLSGEPVQYVVGKALFGDRYFSVVKGVLIPRPETEELCQWIAEEIQEGQNLLDVGTGSGCIAISIALDTQAEVTAWDIADEALATAKKNAINLNANVKVEKQDILQPPSDGRQWDIIVSNPPYICEKEKAGMDNNVLEHEPHLALFVPDDDPLRFYRAIARYATSSLSMGGTLYFEINPAYRHEMELMLASEGFTHVETRVDMFGKQRMMKAKK